MAADDRTDRFRPVFEPEEIFDRFVKNANASVEGRPPRDDEPTGVVTGEPSDHRRGGASWDHQVTVRGAPPGGDDDGTRPSVPLPEALSEANQVVPAPPEVDEDDATVVRASPLAALTDSGQRVVLLTKVKRPSAPPAKNAESSAHAATWSHPARPQAPRAPSSAGEPVGAAPSQDHVPTRPGYPLPAGANDEEAGGTDPVSWESVVGPRGEHTQRIEASKLVPDVSAVQKDAPPSVTEGIEDGQMPTRELDRILSDMGVLLRYGHAGQVRDHLEKLRRTYPEDLLLLRRIAEFHLQHDQNEAALEALFALAGGLFERRNVEGMRQALEQVLVIDPENARAFRLLALLSQRPQDASAD